MGPRNIHLQRKTRSRPPSVASDDEEDFNETGVHVSPAGVSPPFSVAHTQSQSGSSSHPGDYVHLHYPGELVEQEPEVYPYDSASRLDSRDRPRAPRRGSSRREVARPGRAPPAPRQRARPLPPPTDSSSESGDSSTEEFLMPRPKSYYDPNGYTQSSSSGSYGYPPVPPSGQMVHYAAQQQHQGMPQHYQQHSQYPPMSSPPAPLGYPSPPQGYHNDPRMRHEPNGHGGYRPHSYGPAGYGPQGYFPPGYHPQQYPQGYYPGGPAPYLPPFMHDWQVASHSRRASPPGEKKDKDKDTEKAIVVAPPPQPPAPPVSQEEILKRMHDIFLESNKEREEKEKSRLAAIQSAEERAEAIRKAEHERAKEEARIRADALEKARKDAEAAAKAQAERKEQEERIRQEAVRAAEKAFADKAAAAAEQAAREARIREEAAREALEKAAAAAKAKAEQEAKEAKIASDAAEAAKSAAEKEAAAAAAKKEEDAKKATDEAEKKLKEAEEAAAKAKTEAESANAAAAAAKPAEKKAPVRFKDAIGRNYNFPWERCCKWRDMENLIIQAFQHIEDLGEHVVNGRYDLIGPDKDIIMPQYWDYIIQPDMHITMMLWPLPEKPPPPPAEPLAPDPTMPAPPLGDGILNLDDLINPRTKGKRDKGKKPIGSGFAQWMIGVPPPKSRHKTKAKKQPDVAGAWPL